MDPSKSTSWAEVRLRAVGVAYCRRSPPPVAGLATHSSSRRRQGPQPGEVGLRSRDQQWGLKFGSFRRMAAGRKCGEVSAPPRGFSVDGPVLAGQGFLGNRKVGAVQTPPPTPPQGTQEVLGMHLPRQKFPELASCQNKARRKSELQAVLNFLKNTLFGFLLFLEDYMKREPYRQVSQPGALPGVPAEALCPGWGHSLLPGAWLLSGTVFVSPPVHGAHRGPTWRRRS